VNSGEVVVVQLVRGDDVGGVACRLNEQQRTGQACLVCAESKGLDFSRAHVGYVAGESVCVHRYCLGSWQDGSVRVR